MKKDVYFSWLAVLLLVNEVSSQSRLYLISGQSNARGRVNQAFSPDTGPFATEYCFGANSLVEVKDPVGENVFAFQSAHTGNIIPALANSFYNETGLNISFIHQPGG